MKNVIKLASLLLLTSLIFISCNKVKSLADVNFDVTFTADLDCVVPPATLRDIDGTFNTSVVIDPTSDPDVAKYINNIKNYEILSMTGTITSISKDCNLVSATSSVYNNSSSADWAFANVPLSVGATLNFGNENGQWATVKQILMDGQQFTVSIQGETDKDDVTFTLQVEIEAKVTILFP